MAKKDCKIIIEEAAKELFCKYGFKRISIEDVCNKAGISRKTFYTYYDNKLDLLTCILTHINNNVKEQISNIIDKDMSFVEKMYQISEYNISQLETISDEFLADMRDSSMKVLKDYFDEISREKKESQLQLFLEAQKNGDVRSDLDPNFMQLYVATTMALHDSPEFLAIYSDKYQLLRELSKMLLYGMAAR